MADISPRLPAIRIHCDSDYMTLRGDIMTSL